MSQSRFLDKFTRHTTLACVALLPAVPYCDINVSVPGLMLFSGAGSACRGDVLITVFSGTYAGARGFASLRLRLGTEIAMHSMDGAWMERET